MEGGPDGRTMVDEAPGDHSVWLRMKNRPWTKTISLVSRSKRMGLKPPFWVQISTAASRRLSRLGQNELAGRVTGKGQVGA